MNLIDWQELYASNRAVIEGRRAERPDVPWQPDVRWQPDVGGLPTTLPPAREQLPPAHGGRWERLSHEAGGRARGFHVYTPPGLDASSSAPLVVMLHGCTQGPASFAAGTAMNAAADRHGFVVAYPEQTREDNQQGCWNWFVAGQQLRDGGEPSFIAGAARMVIDRWTIDSDRVFVAGLSAGGAMASIMAATHPDLFAAVAVHSGLAYRSARNLPGAVTAMRNGGGDPAEMGRAAYEAMGRLARPVPALVIHGSADQVVCPVNGEQVARQWLTTNRLASGGGFEGDFARPAESSRDRLGGRAVGVRRWADRDGRLLQELVEVVGLGHAWSGGTPGGSHTDPRGPVATDAIWDFFARVGGDARR
jgi:poly(hydroxyalkanoate) depolymerase family esterase